MKRLLVLAAVTLVVASLLGMLLRDRSGHTEDAGALSRSLPAFAAESELTSRGLVPYRIRVPKDHEVHLLVRGGTDAPEGLLSLRGYEDLIAPVDIGPGQSRELVFPSTRPGDDFGVALGGELVGRLDVTGGHLEEGHQ